jgi:hypothetical protein
MQDIFFNLIFLIILIILLKKFKKNRITIICLAVVAYLTYFVAFFKMPIGKDPLLKEYHRTIFNVYRLDCEGRNGFSWMCMPKYNILKGANPFSFQILDEWYVKDDNHVYSSGSTEPMKNVDVKTFRLMGDSFYHYYRDKNHVFYGPNILLKQVDATRKPEDFDMSSVKFLGCGYMKDITGVYSIAYSNQGDILNRVNEVDSETFEMLDKNSCSAKDKDFYYNLKVDRSMKDGHITYNPKIKQVGVVQK